MSVLHVIDRVRSVLFLRNLNIEIDRLIGRTREHKVARCIHTHLIDELAERDHLTRALGHTNRRAITIEINELTQHYLKIVRIAPCRHHRLATWDIAVVISAPNVDQEIVAALLLIVVIGNVAHEISKLTVLLDEHAVLLIAEFARLEIRCTILLVNVAALLHGIEGMLHLRLAIFTRNEERMLGEIGIELRAEKLERIAHGLHHGCIATLTERLPAFIRVDEEPFIAIGIDDDLRKILHVRAAIGLLGHLDLFAQQLLITHHERISEDVHLVAFVVHVEFFVHCITCMTHDARHRIAERRPTTMTHMHGAGGIGGDKLHHYLLIASLLGASIVFPVSFNGLDNPGKPFLGEEKVEETRPSHLTALKIGAIKDHPLHQDGGDLPRIHLQGFGADHGHIGGKVAVAFVVGDFNGKGGQGHRLKFTVSHCHPHGFHNHFFELFIRFFNQICHLSVALLDVNRHFIFTGKAGIDIQRILKMDITAVAVQTVADVTAQHPHHQIPHFGGIMTLMASSFFYNKLGTAGTGPDHGNHIVAFDLQRGLTAIISRGSAFIIADILDAVPDVVIPHGGQLHDIVFAVHPLFSFN